LHWVPEDISRNPAGFGRRKDPFLLKIAIFRFLPAVLRVLVSLFGLVVGFGGIQLWLYLLWKAYKGEKLVLPIA
jgi:uncharacterized membrane protein